MSELSLVLNIPQTMALSNTIVPRRQLPVLATAAAAAAAAAADAGARR